MDGRDGQLCFEWLNPLEIVWFEPDSAEGYEWFDKVRDNLTGRGHHVKSYSRIDDATISRLRAIERVDRIVTELRWRPNEIGDLPGWVLSGKDGARQSDPGLYLLRRLGGGVNENTPKIAYTNTCEVDDVQKIRSSGAFYVTKPAHRVLLADFIINPTEAGIRRLSSVYRAMAILSYQCCDHF